LCSRAQKKNFRRRNKDVKTRRDERYSVWFAAPVTGKKNSSCAALRGVQVVAAAALQTLVKQSRPFHRRLAAEQPEHVATVFLAPVTEQQGAGKVFHHVVVAVGQRRLQVASRNGGP